MVLQFNPDQFSVEEKTLEGRTVRYRAFRDIPYAARPVNPEFQKLHVFAPEAYYDGESINGYTLETAPIFVPNTVGGYMPGPLDEPGPSRFSSKHEPNSIFEGLLHGYVVVAPAIRGRVQQGEDGRYNGKAPACIVDYKAVVRFLHAFADQLPGDAEKIITNGTSAGGALSSLMGGTGDHPDYVPYLEEIGAADASDAIYAASCYCPITNLDHADMAYEWEFSGVYDVHRKHMSMGEGGRPSFTSVDSEMPENQIALSRELEKQFPAYVNSLGLVDEDGQALTLDGEGNGPFKKYIEKIVLASADRAMERGLDVSDKKWLTVKDGRAVAMDFKGWIEDITRMKNAPAFDDVTMTSPENDLFGNETVKSRHFTAFSQRNSLGEGLIAEPQVIRMMNPMYYIEDPQAKKPRYWRIRHGECDRDTSLAISAILALKLQSIGCQVDYHSPWNTPHSGDYDLEELFAWIDSICQ